MNREDILEQINYKGKYTKDVKKRLNKLLKKYHPDNNKDDKKTILILYDIKRELENGALLYDKNKKDNKSNKDIFTTNNLFLSKKNGKYGFVDKNDVVIVDYIYDDATEQNSYGYCAIKKDGKWGCIDQEGTVVLRPSLELSQNVVISFIGKWHLAPDINANYYTNNVE